VEVEADIEPLTVFLLSWLTGELKLHVYVLDIEREVCKIGLESYLA